MQWRVKHDDVEINRLSPFFLEIHRTWTNFNIKFQWSGHGDNLIPGHRYKGHDIRIFQDISELIMLCESPTEKLSLSLLPHIRNMFLG